MGKKINIPVKDSHRLINAGSVILLTASNSNSTTITTVAWNMPVSNSPKLIAVSLEVTRFSLEIIEESLSFCVNLPEASLLKQTLYCGTHSGRDIDKFSKTGLTPIKCNQIPTYYIDECVAHVECNVCNIHNSGDHKIVVGEVTASYINEELFNQNSVIDLNNFQLIHHLGGNNFGTLINL
ncbi:MAG: flavin reductase family protein [Spirochaetota bacterium]|nr:flavin reductase family protein [Spirochaetota bacterium]